jgi:hypothetical protein
MTRVLIVFACGLLSTPAYGQVQEIGQAPGRGNRLVTSDPIVISEPGSYRLMSNIVSTANPAILITASDVTLDLNGFQVDAQAANAIVAPQPPPPQSSPGGISVMNGHVRSAGSGIRLALDCLVEKVTVVTEGGTGISGSINCAIQNSTVRGSDLGISCEFCVVESNTLFNTGAAGISAGRGSLVIKNRVTGSGVGLSLDATAGYANNVLSFNGTDVQGGVQIGPNLCASSGICP